MEVLLKQDVPNLGSAGEIRTVADGYGRNYLIPRGMAVFATRATRKHAEAERQVRARRQLRVQREIQEVTSAFHGIVLTFEVRAGRNNQLYGSITNADIAEALEQRSGESVDRRKIELPEPIRQVGSYRVPIRLGDGSTVHVGVVVQQLDE